MALPGCWRDRPGGSDRSGLAPVFFEPERSASEPREPPAAFAGGGEQIILTRKERKGIVLLVGGDGRMEPAKETALCLLGRWGQNLKSRFWYKERASALRKPFLYA
jgi:hypothetical protein